MFEYAILWHGMRTWVIDSTFNKSNSAYERLLESDQRMILKHTSNAQIINSDGVGPQQLGAIVERGSADLRSEEAVFVSLDNSTYGIAIW
jgi:hypothetical protein